MTDEDIGFPTEHDDETELFLHWLRYLRGAVLRNVEGLDDAQARWRPDGKLISLVGIVSHLTNVEYRWIEGGFRGAAVERLAAEFTPDAPRTEVIAAYRARAAATEEAVRVMPLNEASGSDTWAEGRTLRWVLLHLINETARHAGHADAVRELIDGATGE